MSSETIAIIISVLTLCLSIGAIVFSAGKQSEKVAVVAKTVADQGEAMKDLVTKEQLGVLEGRCREEWGRNSDQHKDFYATSDNVIAITAKFEEFGRRLGDIERDVKEILRLMPKRGVE